MDTGRLLVNMIDQVKEAQLKLGYVKETMRLYYPLSSLNALLGTHIATGREMAAALEQSFQEDCVLGELTFESRGERVEVGISPQGVEYIHLCVETHPFLAALIRLFASNHHCSREELCGLFEEFSPRYVCEQFLEEQATGMGFDYALHFEDPAMDPYYYCVKEEMGHTVYHRFTREDYRLLLEEAGTDKEFLS
ncbi:MAG: DUF3877 family protein [Candidatus Gastranaerophilales bacterium]|nr:DUF3877 family protein [Candidatus Gastranaerophilales bacterium]